MFDSSTLRPVEKKIYKLLCKDGSTWLPISEIENLDVERSVKEGLLVTRKRKAQTYVTLSSIHDMEVFIANKLVLKAMKKVSADLAYVDSLIEEYEKSKPFPFSFSKEQKDGIKTMVSSSIAILTGGPGTGKTSVLECVAFVLKRTSKKHIGIQFTAPTGRAAKRITESSGYKATTLQKYTGGFGGNPIRHMCHDFVICDEFSMTDLETMYITMKALFFNVRLFMVGDIDQLPSVGLGSVLRDLIDSEVIPYVQLTKTFRQDNESKLYENIKLINENCPYPLSEGPDFKCIRSEENIFDNCIKEYINGVNTYGLDEVVILTPYRRNGLICANKINKAIQDLINPEKDDLPSYSTRVKRSTGEYLDITFRVNDPVIQLENTKYVANGEIGKVIDTANGEVTVLFADGTVKYSGYRLNQLDLAYAMSIHKSQGAEYKCAIVPLLEENRNLDRNMIYTAVSRAKKYCVIIGTDKVIMDSCKKQSAWKRTTFLSDDIKIQKRAFEIRASLMP